MRSAQVIVRLQGGLGNQLFQYAAGRAIAVRNGARLVVDPRPILAEAPRRQFCLDQFDITCDSIRGHHAWCVRWSCSIRAGKYFRTCYPPAWRYSLVVDRETGFQPEVFRMGAEIVVLQGYWQSHRYFADIEDVLREELVLRSDPDAFNGRLLAEIRACESICIHVRRGDYASVPLFKETIGVCDAGYYQRAIAFLQRLVAEPRFYVFSDEPEWARRELVLPGPARFIDHNLGRSDIEDLRLMTACRHFIIANSSFSWWAAWLGRTQSRIVVCPARWFLQDRSPPEDRVPPSWIRM